MHFQTGVENLLEVVKGMLKFDHTSTAEYSMATWKIICDRAMAKWRPYAKKSAASLGLDELRHIGYGSDIHRAVDPTKKEVTLVESLTSDEESIVTEDVMSRFLSLTQQDEDKARRLMDFLTARLNEIRSHGPALISALSHSDVHADVNLAVIKASEEIGVSPDIFETKFKLRAEDFVDLATMSPLGLLQLMTSFICSDPNHDRNVSFWQALVAWKQEKLKKHERFQSEKQLAIIKLLSVASLCPRCNSKDTKQIWRKTRAADEPFQFLTICMKCNVSTIIE